MKKLVLLTLLLGLSINANAQEVFVSATNKALDGYVTAGYIKNNWGIYAGAPYNEQNLFNTQQGTITSRAKVGIMHFLPNHKFMLGAGIQPTPSGSKANAFIGYAPLKSRDMKLWLIGNLVGDQFAPGLGLSYRVK
jgi:hypothetical protein